MTGELKSAEGCPSFTGQEITKVNDLYKVFTCITIDCSIKDMCNKTQYELPDWATQPHKSPYPECLMWPFEAAGCKKLRDGLDRGRCGASGRQRKICRVRTTKA